MSAASGAAGAAGEAEAVPALLGAAPAIVALRALIPRVAATDAPVLLLGESGTGKEVVARAIHACSPRAGQPFVAIACAALAAGTLDSELFGHVRGAFTGARAGRRGLIEEAHRGTLLLDEIGGMPVELQRKLLRVLEDGQVRPLGASRTRKIDVRVVAVSSADLEDAVRHGRFRADLYYRLNVVSLFLPPLRERGADVALLARHFARQAALRLGRPEPVLAPSLLAALARHGWPGNVRELRNLVERAAYLADGDTLEAAHLGELRAPAEPLLPYARAKRRVVERFTRDYVERVLRAAHGNVSEAARLAGVPRQTLHRWLRTVRRPGA